MCERRGIMWRGNKRFRSYHCPIQSGYAKTLKRACWGVTVNAVTITARHAKASVIIDDKACSSADTIANARKLSGSSNIWIWMQNAYTGYSFLSGHLIRWVLWSEPSTPSRASMLSSVCSRIWTQRWPFLKNTFHVSSPASQISTTVCALDLLP